MKGKLIVIEGTDCSGKETQSNLLIEQINNPEKNINISSDEIILRTSKKEIKVKEGIHFHVACDGLFIYYL